ncbi:MAG TPA: hypothetical protein PLE60_15335, partial [Candidatus Latescibacteria bacterium]|nr:hypothetical protein [Candidatus Latescibacterota bacterium]
MVALEGATNALTASKLDVTNGTARGTLTAGGHLVVTSNLTVNGAVVVASNLTVTEISSGLENEPFDAKNLTVRAADGDMFKGGDLYLLAGGAAEAEPGNVIIRGGIVPGSYMTGSVLFASDVLQTNGNAAFRGLSAHTLGVGRSEWNSNLLASGTGVFSLQSALASQSPALFFQRSRNGGAAALTNDLLGLISGRGYGGETFRQAGGIAIRAGADFSETNNPGVVEILAAATNSSALSMVGRFSAGQSELTGNLILNGTNIATVFSDASNRVVSLEGATNNLNTRVLTNAANITLVSNRVVSLEGATNNMNTRILTNAANIVLVSNRVVSLEGATN